MAITDPTDIAGCKVWLDADDSGVFSYSSGSVVSAWNDKSGNNYHFTQGNPSNAPSRVTSVVNGRAIVRFTSGFRYVYYSGGSFQGSMTAGDLYLVVKLATDNGTESAYIHFNWDTSGNESHFPDSDNVIKEAWGSTVRKTTVDPTPTMADWRLYNVRTASGAFSTHLDGTQLYTTATNTVGFSSSNLPAFGNRLADIAEIIVYDNVIGSTDRTDLHTYIANKYGLTIAGAASGATATPALIALTVTIPQVTAIGDAPPAAATMALYVTRSNLVL